MLRVIKIFSIAAIVLGLLILPASADSTVRTDIKIIHAATGAKHIDPGLEPIISELESVFKYTEYRLLKSDTLRLPMGSTGNVSLPGDRTLIIHPQKMEGDRISYQILIRKHDKIIFKTRVLLKTNSSVTIGGPKFKKGTLLFNISGTTR